MRSLQRFRFVFAAVVLVGCGAGAAAVGCSGDDEVAATGDGGAEGGGGGDGGGNDGTVDTGSPDVKVDTGPTFDAGPPDPLRYHAQVVHIICQKYASCCTSGAQFDTAKCEATFVDPGNGPALALTGAIAPYLDGGHMAFDPVKAQKCFDDINNLGCGVSSSAVTLKMYEDCLGAATGTIALNGTGCRGSAECVPPNHCEVADGGTNGTCVATKAAAAGCNPGYYGGGNFYESQAECGYLVTGQPRYCANQDTFLGYGSGTNTCSPQGSLDAGCYYNFECASGICGTTNDPQLLEAGAYACVASDTLVTQDICNAYKIVDAGDGGG